MYSSVVQGIIADVEEFDFCPQGAFDRARRGETDPGIIRAKLLGGCVLHSELFGDYAFKAA